MSRRILLSAHGDDQAVLRHGWSACREDDDAVVRRGDLGQGIAVEVADATDVLPFPHLFSARHGWVPHPFGRRTHPCEAAELKRFVRPHLALEHAERAKGVADTVYQGLSLRF